MPRFVLVGIGPVVGFVPDFPARDRVVEAIRPSLGVVAHDVLADARPLGEVLRRVEAVPADVAVVLQRDAEPEHRLDAMLDERVHKEVGEGEVVVGGIGLVGVEVAEEVRDVDEDAASEHPAHVVETRKRDAGLLEVGKHRVLPQPEDRRLPDAVHGLDRTQRAGGIDGDAHGDGPGGGRA